MRRWPPEFSAKERSCAGPRHRALCLPPCGRGGLPVRSVSRAAGPREGCPQRSWRSFPTGETPRLSGLLPSDGSFRRFHEIADEQFVVLHTGNMGKKQDLLNVVRAAKLTKADSEPVLGNCRRRGRTPLVENAGKTSPTSGCCPCNRLPTLARCTQPPTSSC